MKRKKICWVTPDWFVDVDVPIVPHLAKGYDIKWIIVFPWRNSRFKESDFEKYKELKGLDIQFVHSNYFRYDPRILYVYHQIKTYIITANPDIVYFNIVPENPYILPLYTWLTRRRTIFTAHDGSIKSIMSPVTKWMFAICYPKCRMVNMFSESQAELFKQNYIGPKVVVIPLALKDFGVPTVKKREDCVSFVSFGSIHQEKNIPLIIEAANQLYEEGIRDFKVSINGRWLIPEQPEQLIRHAEMFELNTSMIPNQDIPNIFHYNHYAIYAYKQMSQSGVLKVAFNYNTPVVVPDLPGFVEEVQEGENGFFFKSENVESLKAVMKKCITRLPEDYRTLTEKMKSYVNERYSTDVVISQYRILVESVLS